MNKPTQQQINAAKETLKAAGYFVDNLWTLQDVQENYPTATDEQANDILLDALTNDATMEQIWYGVNSFAQENYGLVKIES